MSDRFDMNASVSPTDPSQASGLQSPGALSESILASLQRESAGNTGDTTAEALGRIANDVEQFTRNWVGRIRRLIHRSAQLVERESLLAGAIARLNQQQADWARRTEAKEDALREQTQLLTEGWLEVEAERRKAISGGRAPGRTTSRGRSGIVGTARVQSTRTAPIVTTSPAVDAVGNTDSQSMSPDAQSPSQMDAETPSGITESVAPETPPTPSAADQAAAPSPAVIAPSPVAVNRKPPPAPPLQPVSFAGPGPVAPAPILPAPVPTPQPSASDADAIESASKDRQEEFKRMQRAMRSHRNN